MFGWEFHTYYGRIRNSLLWTYKRLGVQRVKVHLYSKGYGGEDQSQITLHAAEGVEFSERNFSFGEFYEQMRYLKLVQYNTIPITKSMKF